MVSKALKDIICKTCHYSWPGWGNYWVCLTKYAGLHRFIKCKSLHCVERSLLAKAKISSTTHVHLIQWLGTQEQQRPSNFFPFFISYMANNNNSNIIQFMAFQIHCSCLHLKRICYLFVFFCSFALFQVRILETLQC